MPVKQKLGRLEKISLSQAWENEARDFTPWLAQDENIALLGETLNIDLEVEAQEKSVGPFRADILCKDTLTSHWVLIENQIARTDHNHLGQIITYAAGLNAVTIVWIANNFTDEHRAALDWLNEVTDDEINFFGLEIELWKIGDSLLAPKFNIISQPNNWSKTIIKTTKGITNSNLTEIQQLQLEYWTDFSQFLHERNNVIRPQKPLPQHWMDFAIGKSNFHLSATLNTTKKLFTVMLYITDPGKEYYKELELDKSNIESEFGAPLEWREIPGKKASTIAFSRKDCLLSEKSNWPEYEEWMAENLEKLDNIFRNRIKILTAEV